MSTGSIGEEVAGEYLVRHGYKILERNYTKRPFGEIDIVAEKDHVLCFIEVKTSRYFAGSGFSPELRVHTEKIRRLKRICEVYLRENNMLDRNWRIDVISVILDQDDAVVSLKHFENAVFGRKY